ncbi:MAG: tetratricopeptide repeat protein, partial [Planctomycetota bacterium]
LTREGVEAAGPAFKEAIEAFNKIPKTDPSYRKAQSRIGEAMVLMGNAAGALKHIDGFLKSNAEFFNDENTRGGLRQPMGLAIFWMANAHDELKQYDKVVSTLKDFESRFKDAELTNFFARVRFLRVTALLNGKNLKDAEKQASLLRKESPSSAWTTQACLAVANGLYASATELAKTGDTERSKSVQQRSVDLYDFWVNNSTDPTAENYQFVGQLHFDIGDLSKATAMWEKALTMFQGAGEKGAAENILIYLANILIKQERYAEALPKFEALFVKKQKDLSTLREVYGAIQLRPTGVAADVHEKKIGEMVGKIVGLAAGDNAALKGEAKRATSGGKLDSEKLLRAFDQSGDTRNALAAATAFTILGDSPTMNSQLRNTTFKLVKTSPDLMAGLARCYSELGQSKLEYPIRAINLYAMLIRAAKPSDGAPPPRPRGTRYSESWFEWKYQLCTVYFNLGSSLKLEDPLKTVCAYIKSMTTLDELARAEEERKGFEKLFQELRDKADSALRKIGKGGCE